MPNRNIELFNFRIDNAKYAETYNGQDNQSSNAKDHLVLQDPTYIHTYTNTHTHTHIYIYINIFYYKSTASIFEYTKLHPP